MKAICPISGIPFKTYDSLNIRIAYPHPIFTLTYEQLIFLLNDIREEDENQLNRLISNNSSNEHEFISGDLAKIKLTSEVIESIQEKNYNNPVFKLYQTKHLTMLGFMKLANLLENEQGYIARPNPHIVEAYFWPAIELFVWVCTIRNPNSLDLLPKYKVSRHNEDMGNLKEYLSILRDIQVGIGSKYYSRVEEKQLENMQRVLAILAKRREANNIALTTGNNKIAATWAMMVTRPSKDVYNFWLAILSAPSSKVTFEGVEVDGKNEIVKINDLFELRDYLEDNLLGPRGDDKSYKKTHEDDSEYYFIARETVLNIVRKHISTLEQGGAGYEIINQNSNSKILSANDNTLIEMARLQTLQTPPSRMDYLSQTEFIQNMARWRIKIKQELIEIQNKKLIEIKEQGKKKETNYEIL